jgi:hypothetical protein
MSSGHPGQNCCPTCEADQDEGIWYLDEAGVCCCRSTNLAENDEGRTT